MPSVAHAVPGVTAPRLGATTGAGDGVGVAVAGVGSADGAGVGLTTTVLSATGDGATGAGVEEVVTGDGSGVGVAMAFAPVGVISANAPPEITGASVGIAGVVGITTLATGVGAAVVAMVTGSEELWAGSGMLPVVPVREPTVSGLQPLGPALQPSRRFAMSDA
jgi:hypothetical protein